MQEGVSDSRENRVVRQKGRAAVRRRLVGSWGAFGKFMEP